MWLIIKPEYWPALKATAIIKIAITTTWSLVFSKPSTVRATAGTKNARTKYYFRLLKILLFSSLHTYTIEKLPADN